MVSAGRVALESQQARMTLRWYLTFHSRMTIAKNQVGGPVEVL